MPRGEVTVTVSFTETAEYQRLVWFLEDAENLARVSADEDLQQLVDECREDLIARRRTPW